jgi:glycosyltransferase involved in cell wall biosynthesis
MKIGIFSPYIPRHFGGGEKHMLTSAWYLSQHHEVDLLVPTDSQPLEALARYEELINRSLDRVHFIHSPLADRTTKAWQTWMITRAYDLFLYATDGSWFWPGSRHNILHVQVPFTNHLSAWNRRKLNHWLINTNSLFTKKIIERSWQVKVPFIHYPYVDVKNIHPSLEKKQAKIVAVGRFFDPEHSDLHAKRQDILIQAFRQGCQQHQWQQDGIELHLVGSIEPDNAHLEYVTTLKKLAAGLPIFFHHDLSYQALSDLYDESLLFWHAAGFGIDEKKSPAKVEHFGMSTLEAMAHGCIPIVVDRGGLKETVLPNVNGFRFETINELVDDTEALLRMPVADQRAWQQQAIDSTQQFSLERFCTTLDTMVEAA